MKRLTIETGLAAVIFLAANAVYGVETSMVQLLDYRSARIPQPMQFDMRVAHTQTQAFCLGPDTSVQQVSVSVPARAQTLMSDEVALPYALDVELMNPHQTSVFDSAICEGEGSVSVSVAVDPGQLALLRDGSFSHTVLLMVDPE